MPTFIRHRETITQTEYSLEYDNNDGHGGFSFPCDKDGNVFNDQTENYVKCINGEHDVTRCGVREYTWDYREPGAIKCVNGCKGEIVLENSYGNFCEVCEAEYNLFGQRMAPREVWRLETNETLADIIGPYDPSRDY